MPKRLSIEERVSIFRSYCTGFGHTKGMPIEKANFTLDTGRDFDLFPYEEVEQMVKEISLAHATGELSVCQKSVLHQLKTSGVLQAFIAIATEEGEL